MRRQKGPAEHTPSPAAPTHTHTPLESVARSQSSCQIQSQHSELSVGKTWRHREEFRSVVTFPKSGTGRSLRWSSHGVGRSHRCCSGLKKPPTLLLHSFLQRQVGETRPCDPGETHGGVDHSVFTRGGRSICANSSCSLVRGSHDSRPPAALMDAFISRILLMFSDGLCFQEIGKEAILNKRGLFVCWKCLLSETHTRRRAHTRPRGLFGVCSLSAAN